MAVMDTLLDAAQVRVLGALIEKEVTTPEYYPLSLNGLVTACNQKSNRWPVVEYEDPDVLHALELLKHHGFTSEITGGSRVAKYRQRFTEVLNLGRRETAILCVLMLRGQQTLGEIKGRTDRLYQFSDLEEVELVVQKLMERPEGALAMKLAPAPGMKEPRYAQLLGGSVEAGSDNTAPVASASGNRMGALEEEVARLRKDVDDLRARLEEVFVLLR
jgi:uncharacterized protein YceH (UPF0502 family)